MKKKSARLKPVAQLADKQATSATEQMVSARNNHQEHEVKLKELINYRFEYLESYQTKAKTGMQAGQMQQYQQFISKLDIAIEQQRIVVSQSTEVLVQSQTHWQKKNSHKNAIDNAVTRFKKQEYKVEEKIEQAATDERNTQMHNLKKKS